MDNVDNNIDNSIKSKLISYISFAKKAHCIFLGNEAVQKAIIANKYKKSIVVFLLKDASDRTKRTFINLSSNYKIDCKILTLSCQDLFCIFQKKIAVLAISNENLSSAILKLIL